MSKKNLVETVRRFSTIVKNTEFLKIASSLSKFAMKHDDMPQDHTNETKKKLLSELEKRAQIRKNSGRDI